MLNEIPDDMVQQLLKLPYEQRDQLANALVNSLHPAGEEISQDEWRSAWMEECHRRTAEIDNGEVAVISADDLIARMQAKHSE